MKYILIVFVSLIIYYSSSHVYCKNHDLNDIHNNIDLVYYVNNMPFPLPNSNDALRDNLMLLYERTLNNIGEVYIEDLSCVYLNTTHSMKDSIYICKYIPDKEEIS